MCDCTCQRVHVPVSVSKTTSPFPVCSPVTLFLLPPSPVSPLSSFLSPLPLLSPVLSALLSLSSFYYPPLSALCHSLLSVTLSPLSPLPFLSPVLSAVLSPLLLSPFLSALLSLSSFCHSSVCCPTTRPSVTLLSTFILSLLLSPFYLH
ncbi:hypothetical protein Pcinc_005226 [Petrolisthes cinctipes]|uniref:Uncharacterized protein n=1 Tax=Petrolisthes cinctipes TaxID=88211 RepID=A0AAE1GJY0_PETCI|nr:hypothetical protein Pcinc_005226 [Petrolisthes cinctipes]